MKYDVVLSIDGSKFRFKDVEAANQEAAEIKCTQELKRKIKLASIQPSPAVRNEKKSNATQIPPVSGDDIWNQFFRNN
jgi:hypothetical protein